MREDGLLAVSIDYGELTTRALGRLRAEGLLAFGAVEDLSDAELLSLPGIGRGTAHEIRGAMETLRRRYHRGLPL